MNALARFFSPESGQRRRAWLDGLDDRATNALRYYGGPAGESIINALNLGAVVNDAADFQEYWDAGRELMSNPSLGSGANLAAAGAALMVPGLSKKLLDEGTQAGIRAYHGSPHDFDRFSMDKIGTGEGAQAYGHGLYFAESEGVAKSYRDALARGDSSDPVYNAYDLIKHGLPKDEARAIFQEVVDEGGKTWPAHKRAEMVDFARRSVEAIDSGAVDAYTPPGHMYEVRINADPADFLDWDAPLSEQSPKVQDFANQRYQQFFGRPAGSDVDGEMIKRIASPQNDLDGREWLDIGPAADASKRLQSAGIPGIKYRDAGSRDGVGDATRNYVVFDDSLIEIIRKYGWAAVAPYLGYDALSSSGDES